LDDLGDYRPGIEALKQNGIMSPLVETNFSKSENLTFSRHYIQKNQNTHSS